jgi:queuine tRNA-ribosyltransferase
MPLDVCTPYPVDEKTSKKDMERTIAWFDLSNARFNEKGAPVKGMALLPIVQGATYIDQRMHCVEKLLEFDSPGIAIGGLSVGEPKEDRQRSPKRTGRGCWRISCLIFPAINSAI